VASNIKETHDVLLNQEIKAIDVGGDARRRLDRDDFRRSSKQLACRQRGVLCDTLTIAYYSR
jgi:hypothetical protein